MNKKTDGAAMDLEIQEKGIDDADREVLEEVRAQLQEMVDFMYSDDQDFDNDYNLYTILMDDDALQEELVDKTALLNAVLMAAEDDAVTDEDIEGTYLSVIDTMFELSKSVNPIAGFGRDRLLGGLSILEYFEKNYWAVSTRIIPENADAFKEFIPEEHFDDVVYGRKQAIGALRRIGGESFAAGAVVFSTDTDAIYDIPLLRLEWIEVDEGMRRQGVGNMLLAEAMEPFVKSGDFMLAAELPIIRQDEDNAEEAGVLENFLDSWRIEFSVTAGRRFALDSDALSGNEALSGPYDGAVALEELGDMGQSMVRDFFRKQNKEYDKEFMTLPFSYFDPHVSTAITENGRITALFLVHAYESGDYRYEALRCPKGYDGPEFKKLLSRAYANYRDRGGDGGIFGFFDSEEGRDAIAELFPEIDLPMCFTGTLAPPERPITAELWDELRHAAGLSDDKIPDVDLTEEELTEENAALFAGALREML